MYSPNNRFKMDRATKVALAVSQLPQCVTGKYVGEATSFNSIKAQLISAQIANTPVKQRRATAEKEEVAA